MHEPTAYSDDATSVGRAVVCVKLEEYPAQKALFDKAMEGLSEDDIVVALCDQAWRDIEDLGRSEAREDLFDCLTDGQIGIKQYDAEEQRAMLLGNALEWLEWGPEEFVEEEEREATNNKFVLYREWVIDGEEEEEDEEEDEDE